MKESSFEFAINGVRQKLDRKAETTPLLFHLRETLGLTGTKEGCCEGDCGACMVLVGRAASGRMSYRPMNACITLLGAIEGQAVTTIEAVAHGNGILHPVQQLLVEHHGSQCGFCTPGFVMSLVALFTRRSKPGRDDIQHALAGNLCRCTGYRPILEAAQELSEEGRGTVDARHEQRDLGMLRDIVLERPVQASHRPSDLNQLLRMLDDKPASVLIAGGTDLVPQWVEAGNAPTEVIWIGAVDDLRHLTRSEEYLEIGASVTLAETGAMLSDEYPELTELSRRIASPSITHAGTIGGNLANGSPVGDWIPTLIALGALVQLHSTQGTRWLPLEAFYLGYRKTCLTAGELIESVRIPTRKPNQHVAAYKVAKRFEQDTATVLAAFSIQVEGGTVSEVRVSYGGLSAVHGRARHAESAMLGQRWHLPVIESATRALANDYQPIGDVRGSGEYRTAVAANLLRKFYWQISSAEPVSVWREGNSDAG